MHPLRTKKNSPLLSAGFTCPPHSGITHYMRKRFLTVLPTTLHKKSGLSREAGLAHAFPAESLLKGLPYSESAALALFCEVLCSASKARSLVTKKKETRRLTVFCQQFPQFSLSPHEYQAFLEKPLSLFILLRPKKMVILHTGALQIILLLNKDAHFRAGIRPPAC